MSLSVSSGVTSSRSARPGDDPQQEKASQPQPARRGGTTRVQALTDLDGGHVEAGAEGHNENHPFPRELAGQGSGHHHFKGRGEATMARIPFYRGCSISLYD